MELRWGKRAPRGSDASTRASESCVGVPTLISIARAFRRIVKTHCKAALQYLRLVPENSFLEQYCAMVTYIQWDAYMSSAKMLEEELFSIEMLMNASTEHFPKPQMYPDYSIIRVMAENWHSVVLNPLYNLSLIHI